ncbi:MAG: DegT/DnrJ/EryC1/StrS family aminotransferase [Clostridiales bacterium]|jgi:dTDP-4-amino-4,6-dideoxygalactose transaminase|nr:DegT/DnrJ/EryC1/StrS family aminotransferase [Clostridiales bacterium]
MDNIPVITPFFDDEEIKEIQAALESGWVAQGPKVEAFERIIAEHEGAGFGVATTSCTTALQLAIKALGVGKGHDVIVPAFTFVATANAAVCEGAAPVFADVNPRTYNMSPESLRAVINRYKNRGGALVNPVTGNVLKLIIPVHLFGLCADMQAINKLAGEYGLAVLEDSACALGSKIGNMRQGAFGNMSCLSFHPRKSITTGEGGMVLTDDANMAEKMRSLRSHGASASGFERHEGVHYGFLLPDFNGHGYNFRMTDIQAAMGIAQAKKLDYIIKERREKAAYYDLLLKEITGFKPPLMPQGYFHAYQSYVCLLDEDKVGAERAPSFRNGVMLALAKRNISTRVGTHALHNTGYYKKLYALKPDDFPEADRCERLSITLPLYVSMSKSQQERVIAELDRAYAELMKSGGE